MAEYTMELEQEFAQLIRDAHTISLDVGRDVEEVLQQGRGFPLSMERVRALLTTVIRKLQERSLIDGLDGDEIDAFVETLVAKRDAIRDDHVHVATKNRVHLREINGISPRAVLPKPVFHGREVALWEGYIRTLDVQLWDENERLEIHLQQFQRKYNRRPNPAELLDIMLSKMSLDGVTETDQFQIPNLARSIAANGVRRPPIVALDGTLLDGNRRLAACYYILNSEEFSTEEKKRVEHIVAWQLTEHATEEDVNAILVSLNFEPDYKQSWPEYVKARKVYESFQEALTLEPHANVRRQAIIKRTISQKFALGSETGTVSRYIKMVEVANEFEDYHVHDKKRDSFEVKHKASEYFQYFDELSKGAAGGVSYALNQSPEIKHVVFELLFGDKFMNWRQIRELRYVVDHEEARDLLFKAAKIEATSDEELEDAQQKVQTALSLGRARHAEQRTVGANTRIKSFVEWLLQVPISAFDNEIRPENLKLLQRALTLVNGIIQNQGSTQGVGD